jgi:hypothetical protein
MTMHCDGVYDRANRDRPHDCFALSTIVRSGLTAKRLADFFRLWPRRGDRRTNRAMPTRGSDLCYQKL